MTQHRHLYSFSGCRRIPRSASLIFRSWHYFGVSPGALLPEGLLCRPRRRPRRRAAVCSAAAVAALEWWCRRGRNELVPRRAPPAVPGRKLWPPGLHPTPPSPSKLPRNHTARSTPPLSYPIQINFILGGGREGVSPGDGFYDRVL